MGITMPKCIKCMYVHPGFQKFSGGDPRTPDLGWGGRGKGGERHLFKRGEGLLLLLGGMDAPA